MWRFGRNLGIFAAGGGIGCGVMSFMGGYGSGHSVNLTKRTETPIETGFAHVSAVLVDDEKEELIRVEEDLLLDALENRDGRIVVVCGENGSGRKTLIHRVLRRLSEEVDVLWVDGELDMGLFSKMGTSGVVGFEEGRVDVETRRYLENMVRLGRVRGIMVGEYGVREGGCIVRVGMLRGEEAEWGKDRFLVVDAEPWESKEDGGLGISLDDTCELVRDAVEEGAVQVVEMTSMEGVVAEASDVGMFYKDASDRVVNEVGHVEGARGGFSSAEYVTEEGVLGRCIRETHGDEFLCRRAIEMELKSRRILHQPNENDRLVADSKTKRWVGARFKDPRLGDANPVLLLNPNLPKSTPAQLHDRARIRQAKLEAPILQADEADVAIDLAAIYQTLQALESLQRSKQLDEAGVNVVQLECILARDFVETRARETIARRKAISANLPPHLQTIFDTQPLSFSSTSSQENDNMHIPSTVFPHLSYDVDIPATLIQSSPIFLRLLQVIQRAIRETASRQS